MTLWSTVDRSESSRLAAHCGSGPGSCRIQGSVAVHRSGAANGAIWLGPAALVIFATVQFVFRRIPAGRRWCWRGAWRWESFWKPFSRKPDGFPMFPGGPIRSLRPPGFWRCGRVCSHEHRRPGLVARETAACGLVRRRRGARLHTIRESPWGPHPAPLWLSTFWWVCSMRRLRRCWLNWEAL